MSVFRQLQQLAATPQRAIQALAAPLPVLEQLVQIRGFDEVTGEALLSAWNEQLPGQLSLLDKRLDDLESAEALSLEQPEGSTESRVLRPRATTPRFRPEKSVSREETQVNVARLLSRVVGPVPVTNRQRRSSLIPDALPRPQAGAVPPISRAEAAREWQARAANNASEAAFNKPLHIADSVDAPARTSADPNAAHLLMKRRVAAASADNGTSSSEVTYPQNQLMRLLNARLDRIQGPQREGVVSREAAGLRAETDPRAHVPRVIRNTSPASTLDNRATLPPADLPRSGLRRLAALAERAQSEILGSDTPLGPSAPSNLRTISIPAVESSARPAHLGDGFVSAPSAPVTPLLGDARLDDDAIEERLSQILRREARRHGIDVDDQEPWP